MTSSLPSSLPFSDDALTEDKFLGGKITLLQPKRGYRAGTDPVFLAAACPAKPNQSVLELGCGVGTSLLCLAARVKVRATGLERIEAYADLARRNAAANDTALRVFDGDITRPPAPLKDEMFDHVLLNPPFFRDGKRAEDAGRAHGRQEDTPLSDWLDHALKRTRPKGYVTLIHLTERLADVISHISSRVGSVEIKPLAARQDQLPKRFILRARKTAKGGTTLYNPLIIHDGPAHEADEDSFSEGAKRILRDGSRLEF